MTRRPPILLCLLAVLLFAGRTLAADAPETVTVTAEGVAQVGTDIAAAEDEALWDARRNAVEQAAGILLKSHSVGSQFALERDDIESRTQGFLKHWERIEGSRWIEKIAARSGNKNRAASPSQILHVRIQAEVALLPLLQRLRDARELYRELERPRLRVEATGSPEWDEATRSTSRLLIGVLQQQGFEVVTGGTSEVTLHVGVKLTPRLRLGDGNAPYGLKGMAASFQAEVNLQIISQASEEVLYAFRAEGQGRSLQSDGDAAQEAAEQAVNGLLAGKNAMPIVENTDSAHLTANDVEDAAPEPNANFPARVDANVTVLFVQTLLARWARERYEGHAVVVKITGYNVAQGQHLRQHLAEMRGFRKFLSVTADRQHWAARFVTRLDTPLVRERLRAFFAADRAPVTIVSQRGPLIVCHSRRSNP